MSACGPTLGPALAPGDLAAFTARQQANHFPAIHHSEEYRRLYRPAYRLVALNIKLQEQDRAQVEELARQVQEVTEQSVELAYVDQGYTGEAAAEAAQSQGMQLEVIKSPEARKGFVLLPRR